jgi:hypothetical protein
MARIDVPAETLLVEMGDEGLNILETTLVPNHLEKCRTSNILSPLKLLPVRSGRASNRREC